MASHPQTLWLILKCLARWSQKLALSELEVVTLGLALLNGITYALWGNTKAFRIPKNSRSENSIDNPPVSELGSEPTVSGNVKSPELSKTLLGLSKTPTNVIAPVTMPDVGLLSTLASMGDAPTEPQQP